MPGSLKYFFYTPLAPYSLTYWHLFYFSKFVWYCTISNCLAWPVTRDHCAEILLRQTPVWPVTWPNFGDLKFRPGMLRLNFHRFRPIISITSSQLAKGEVTRDNTWISAPSGGSVTRDRRTIRNGTVLLLVLSYAWECDTGGNKHSQSLVWFKLWITRLPVPAKDLLVFRSPQNAPSNPFASL